MAMSACIGLWIVQSSVITNHFEGLNTRNDFSLKPIGIQMLLCTTDLRARATRALNSICGD